MLASTTAHLDVNFLTLLLAVLIPVATGVITKASASARLKSLVTIALVVLTTLVQRVITANGVVDLKTMGTTFVVMYVTAIAAYSGFLKPSGVTPSVQDATANFGLK